MKREKILIGTLTIRISELLNEKYKKYCDENGLSLSKRLRYLIEKDIEGKIEIKNDIR
jgi:hypothetical protein